MPSIRPEHDDDWSMLNIDHGSGDSSPMPDILASSFTPAEDVAHLRVRSAAAGVIIDRIDDEAQRRNVSLRYMFRGGAVYPPMWNFGKIGLEACCGILGSASSAFARENALETRAGDALKIRADALAASPVEAVNSDDQIRYAPHGRAQRSCSCQDWFDANEDAYRSASLLRAWNRAGEDRMNGMDQLDSISGSQAFSALPSSVHELCEIGSK
ncbi:hypothetical protein Slin15195_G130720 [Septoria linicola]|uniref:Uncharacterized protein n=1 Tax=Septoria linicola TaxID=215465 RepID=A0A9Q9B693_9PEZI|nr:hypothetical protein Slin15195_G130720 [Septoria linicola]